MLRSISELHDQISYSWVSAHSHEIQILIFILIAALFALFIIAFMTRGTPFEIQENDAHLKSWQAREKALLRMLNEREKPQKAA